MRTTPSCDVKPGPAGFTLVEVLAALLLMAIVVPVVVRGLSIATQAGEVSQRKAYAARLADRLLNEAILNGQWNQSAKGVENMGSSQFRWSVRNENWHPPQITQDAITVNAMRQVSVDVTYTAQGKSCQVQLSTLVNSQAQ